MGTTLLAVISATEVVQAGSTAVPHVGLMLTRHAYALFSAANERTRNHPATATTVGRGRRRRGTGPGTGTAQADVTVKAGS